MKGAMRVYYDEAGDFLEISAGTPIECYTIEIEPGVFLRKDERTDEVKSVGILSFKKRSREFKDLILTLPIEIQLGA